MAIKEEVKKENNVAENVTPTNSPVNPTGEQATPSLLTEDIIWPSPVDTTVEDTTEDIREPLKAEETKAVIEPVTPQDPVVIPEPVKEVQPTTIEAPKEDVAPIKTEEEIRKEVEESMAEKSTEQIFAEQNSVSFKKNKDGTVTFDPANLDEAIDLFAQFWPTAKIAKGSKEAIAATQVFQKYSKYKWGTVETYIDGLKAWEIATGGATWERLVKMNWGQPTDAMLAASAQYDTFLKTSAINENSKELYKSFWGQADTGTEITETKKTQTSIEALDQSYLKTKVNLFENIEAMYRKFQAGSESTNALRKDAQETAGQMDELRVEKRKIMKNIRKKFPNLPLSAQLTLARQQTEVVDDQLFVLQRDYSNQFADYQFADTKDKSAFDFNVNMLNQKNQLVENIYGIQRGDMIRESEVARQEVNMSNEIARQEKLLENSLKRKDKETATKQAHDLALLKMKSDINNENRDKFSTANVSGGGVMVLNRQTWEYEVVSGSTWVTPTTAWVTPTWVAPTAPAWAFAVTEWTTTRRPDRNKNPWNLKMGDVWFWVDDQRHTIFGSAQQWFDALVKDLEAKQTWNTRTGLTWESTLAELGKVFAEDPKWGQGVSRISGIALETQLKDIDMDFLASHIIKQEWFTWNVSSAPTWVAPAGELSKREELTRSNLIDSIWKQLFWKTISNDEWKRTARKVELWRELGLSSDEIIDEILFFKPTANQDLGKAFKDILMANNVELWQFNMRTLARLLSDGKLSKAVTKVEQWILDDSRKIDPEWFVSERLTKTMVRRADELNGLIEQLNNTEEGKKNPIWTTEWTIENWLGRFKSKESVEIKNRATRLVSDFRLKNLWSAVTETESVFLDWVVPELFDSTENFVTKVDQFKDQALWEINDFRWLLELPALDAWSLIDKNLRVGWYIWSTGEDLGKAAVWLSASIWIRNYLKDVTPSTSNTPIDSYLDSLQLTQ